MYNNKLVRAYQMAPSYIPNSLAKKPTDVRTTLGPVDREFANVETEGGETVYLPNKDGLPAHYKISGPRHYEGGVPMSVPPDSFIYSDTASMRIKNPEFQTEFGMPVSKKGYTPAEIAKRYDINKYRKILANPDSDKLQINTAEHVIANYEIKLAKLALIQESMKGFPNGIPLVAIPYIAKYQLDASQFLPTDLRQGVMSEGAMQEMPEAKYGQAMKFQTGGQLGRGSSPQYVSVPGGGQVRLTRWQKKQIERQNTQTILDQALKNVVTQEKEPEVKPDLSTGSFLKIDTNGNPYYVDGHGVRIAKFDNIYYGKNNIPTEGDSRIIERDGKRYKVSVNKTKSTIDKSKVKPKDQATAAGDIYFDEENGKYYQIQQFDNTKPIGATKSGSEYYTGDIEKDKGTALNILNRLGTDGHALYHSTPYVVAGKERKPGWEIKASASKGMTTDEKEFLTDFLSYGKQDGMLGPDTTPEYNISLQGANKGFYGYTDPDFYEYRYWKAEHMDQKAADWDKQTEAQKLENRTRMFTSLGYDVANDDFLKGNLNNPENLYTTEFVSGAKKAKHFGLGEAGFADGIEKYFAGDKYKPDDPYRPGFGSDKKLGLEHADAFSFEKGLKDITPEEKETTTEEEVITNAKSPKYVNQDGYAPWWLQDVVRTTGAAMDYLSIKKYMPAKYQYNPYVPEPTYYDPAREIAALQETANIAKGLIAGSGNKGSSTYSARAAAIQGTAAEQIANVMGKYNTQNVSVANEFAYKAADIMNDAQVKNLGSAQTYVDQVNTVNQNYDNAKRAGREQIRSAYIDAITNRANAQVLNSLYPNYQIDPASGGMMYFNDGTDVKPGSGSSNATTAQANAFLKWSEDTADSNLSPDQKINLWNGLSKRASAESSDASERSDYMSNYTNMINNQNTNPMGNYYEGAQQQKHGGVNLPFTYNVGY